MIPLRDDTPSRTVPLVNVLIIVACAVAFLAQLAVLPAALFLGLWFVLQLFRGTLAIGSIQAGGVAWWAHIGGFVFGVATARVLGRRGRLREAPPCTPPDGNPL